jgi:hypothetical protein
MDKLLIYVAVSFESMIVAAGRTRREALEAFREEEGKRGMGASEDVHVSEFWTGEAKDLSFVGIPQLRR